MTACNLAYATSVPLRIYIRTEHLYVNFLSLDLDFSFETTLLLAFPHGLGPVFLVIVTSMATEAIFIAPPLSS